MANKLGPSRALRMSDWYWAVSSLTARGCLAATADAAGDWHQRQPFMSSRPNPEPLGDLSCRDPLPNREQTLGPCHAAPRLARRA